MDAICYTIPPLPLLQYNSVGHDGGVWSIDILKVCHIGCTTNQLSNKAKKVRTNKMEKIWSDMFMPWTHPILHDCFVYF